MTLSFGFFARTFLVLCFFPTDFPASAFDVPIPEDSATADTTEVKARLQRAADLRRGGRHAEAEKELRELLTFVERRHGTNSSVTPMIRCFLGNSLLGQKRYPEAEKELRLALLALDRTRPTGDNPSFNQSFLVRSSLGRALQGQHKFQEAEAEFRTLYREQERTLGPENQATLESRVAIADQLCGQNRFADAESEYRAALSLLERLLDPNIPLKLSTFNGLAFALSKQNKPSEAREMSWRAVTGGRRWLGLGHPTTKQYEKFYQELNNNRLTPPPDPEDDKSK